MKYVRRATKYVLVPGLLILLGAILAANYLIGTAKTLNADGNWFESERGIDTSTYVTLGGVEQFVRIRSRDRDHPILLDLHGGPGSAQTPWTHRLLRPLTEYFTLVEWDQRGAGRSESGKSIVSTMSYDRMVEDTIELIEHLQIELGQEKVILVGHSWGSMLGLGVIRERPDLIHAYVGVGQALAWPGGFDETQRLVIAAAENAGDTRTVNALRALPEDWPPQDDVDGLLKRIGTIQAPMVTYGTSLHASKSNSLFNGDIVLDVATSPEIGILETMSLLDVTSATKALMADLYGRDLRVDFGHDYDVPIFIFQGAHDWQTPTTLVVPWFAELTAPHKDYVSFENSAHMVINEEPGKFLVELVNRVRPYAMQSGASLLEVSESSNP